MFQSGEVLSFQKSDRNGAALMVTQTTPAVPPVLEPARVLIALLCEGRTEVELARVMERYELICASRGWSLPSSE